MSKYSFVTTWQFEAPIQKVWDLIYDSDRWPEWWKGVEKVETLKEGGPDGLGAVKRYTWKSFLPYRLVFDMRLNKVKPPETLEGAAFGELEGTGRWELKQAGKITTVNYFWDVSTTKKWMNLLAPLARPVFGWNHDYVMGHGGEGLARQLGTNLINPKK